jgi:spore maturation protein CgeB
MCAYYLQHEDERQAIARQGQATVREHHSFVARMIDLFTTVQAVRGGQPVALSRWYP